MITTGLDTGFFILLLAGHPECVAVWQEVTEGRVRALVSCLVLTELRRLALRGLIETSDADLLSEAVGAVCQVTWIDRPEVLQRAAHLAHGAGLPLVDALIVAGLESEGASEIWTTDGDLVRCDREGFRVRLLKPQN